MLFFPIDEVVQGFCCVLFLTTYGQYLIKWDFKFRNEVSRLVMGPVFKYNVHVYILKNMDEIIRFQSVMMIALVICHFRWIIFF